MTNPVISSQAPRQEVEVIELPHSSPERSRKERIVAAWDSVKVGIGVCCAFIAAGIIMMSKITLISAALITGSCLLLIAGSCSLLAVFKRNFTSAAVPTNQPTSKSPATPANPTPPESSEIPKAPTTSESQATSADPVIPADRNTHIETDAKGSYKESWQAFVDKESLQAVVDEESWQALVDSGALDEAILSQFLNPNIRRHPNPS